LPLKNSEKTERADLDPEYRPLASEAEARKQAPKLRVNSGKATDWYTARRVGEAVYGYKTLIEAERGRILGAHLVGPHADEVINVFGLAIRHNLTADDLKTTMFA
jgi:glutathione reductase (NADPH)